MFYNWVKRFCFGFILWFDILIQVFQRCVVSSYIHTVISIGNLTYSLEIFFADIGSCLVDCFEFEREIVSWLWQVIQIYFLSSFFCQFMFVLYILIIVYPVYLQDFYIKPPYTSAIVSIPPTVICQIWQ